MIKSSVLTPRLAEIGKIKIGGKGEVRQKKGKPGQTYQLPVRYGHFVVTTTERDPQTGNFKPNQEIMSGLPDKPRELKIRLLFDDIHMNLQTEFAMYHGKKKACSSNGETAFRLKKKDNVLTDEKEQLDCPNFDCKFFDEGKCKTSARLFCSVTGSTDIGGIYVFRTHSVNSVAAMLGSLLLFSKNTNGILQGLPLKLMLVKKQTEEHGEVDFVTIVLDGVELLEMRKLAVAELENRKLLGVNISEYEQTVKTDGILIDHDDPEEIEDEFYQQEPALHGSSADDVAAKLEQSEAEPEPPQETEPAKTKDRF